MIAIDKEGRSRLAGLFEAYRWNYLAEAILEGTMGTAMADDADDPHVAILEVPNLRLCVVGGDAGRPCARQYIEQLSKLTALFFASEGWEGLVQQIHAGKLIAMPRHAFTSEALEIDHLRELASHIPDGYGVEQVDLDLAQRLGSEKSGFAAAHMVNFRSPRDFIERGFGFCVLHGDEIASAATTFAVCQKGVEIQINTRGKHRRRGLATVVAAHLIIHSLENNLDPNWDAANESSVGLATKLGYTPQGTYSTLFYTGSKALATIAQAGLKAKAFLEIDPVRRGARTARSAGERGTRAAPTP